MPSVSSKCGKICGSPVLVGYRKLASHFCTVSILSGVNAAVKVCAIVTADRGDPHPAELLHEIRRYSRYDLMREILNSDRTECGDFGGKLSVQFG